MSDSGFFPSVSRFSRACVSSSIRHLLSDIGHLPSPSQIRNINTQTPKHNTSPHRRRAGLGGSRVFDRRVMEGERNRKDTAPALDALYVDSAVHQLDEAGGDGQPQAAALVRTRQPARLLFELVKQITTSRSIGRHRITKRRIAYLERTPRPLVIYAFSA